MSKEITQMGKMPRTARTSTAIEQFEPCELSAISYQLYFIRRLLIIPILVLLSGLIFFVSADAATKKVLTPRISVQEQYDDNINLESENEDSDWITLVSPGISLELKTQDTTMNLDYEAGFSFYRDDSSKDSTRHQGRVEWDQSLSRYFRLRVSDTFARSEDPIVETEGEIEDIRRERSTYYRNNGEVSVSYEFGAEDQITVGYSNRYVDDKSSSNEDSQGHGGFLNLDTWFSQEFGIGISSRYNRGQFEQADDFDQYETALTLNYRWEPTRRLYARYNFLYHDFDQPDVGAQTNDYRVHRGALGVSLSLGPNTDFNVEGGYFLQDYLYGDETEGGMFSGSLSSTIQRFSMRLTGSGGYDEDYFSSENLGSSKYRQVLGSANYLLTKNLRVFGSGSYRWEEFHGADVESDRKDKVWRGTGGLSLSFWRWLTLSLQGTHSERDSDDPSMDFEDNRVMLRLTGAYPYVF